MYQKHRSFSRGGRGANRSFRPNNRRRVKQIDPRFFVQKAVFTQEEKYAPQHSFADFALDPKIKQNIYSCGYDEPTPIQDQVIIPLLEGRDVVGIASTGTGKTAAFLLPLIQKVIRQRNQRILIIAPTRELAVQIDQEFRKFATGLGLYSVLCIGGVGMHPQIYALRRNPSFVIGTPGRLADLERQRKLEFRQYNCIVLDEVDRMLDMGFVQEVKLIMSKLPRPRQSLFFSATMSIDIQNIIKGFVTNPITVTIKASKPSGNVDQDVIRVGNTPKVEVLHKLLTRPEFEKVLVFGRTKWGTEKLAKDLEQRGFRVASIHGNKKQSQRQRAITDFKQNRVQVLLATDIASRGLDIDNVTHVINFDQPESYEDYIHRIGRTGRAGRTGIALTFI